MVERLFVTDESVAPALLRIAMAVVMFPHGAQKLLGWFGGYGFSGTMNYFTNHMRIPWIFALAAVLAEFFGSLALLVGLGTRPAAALIGIVMVVAVFTSHIGNGLFMNWFGNQRGEGFGFHILMLAIAVALMILGGGAWSMDQAISKVL